MIEHATDFGNSRQPLSVISLRQYGFMVKSAAKILARNVDILATRKFGVKYQTKLINAGVSNGSITRALSGENEPRTSTIDQLAKALNVPAWMLLVENIDPDDLPVIVPKRAADAAKAGMIAIEALQKINEASRQ